MTCASGCARSLRSSQLKAERIAERLSSLPVRVSQSFSRTKKFAEPAEVFVMTASAAGEPLRLSLATASTTLTVWFMEVPSGIVIEAMNMPWSSFGTKVEGTSL